MQLSFSAAAIACVFVASCLVSAVEASEPQATRVYALIDGLIEDGTVAGAQVAIGVADSQLVGKSFGTCDISDPKPVTADTQFCIGSCSKMFAAAVLVSLSSEAAIDLDEPIDRWLNSFSDPKLIGGGMASRAPTLRELLCHRAGIYSQRNRMTSDQIRWIRDFKLSLADSVDGIAAESLIAEPNEQFAYSGAGYCLLGRVAEVAADKSFDELLAIHVARPLNLSRTTYFPVGDTKIAVGHELKDGKLSVVESSPHLLGTKHRLALIGGSIYAPAREVAEFARMLLHKGKVNDREVLSSKGWTEMTAPHSQRAGNSYGLGLALSIDAETGLVQTASHSGALFGSYSVIAVNFRTKRFGVVNFTGQRNRQLGDTLRRWVNSDDDMP